MRQNGVERGSRARKLGAVLALAWAVAGAGPVWADDYERLEAGHPVRILAYVMHPVGWLLDVAIMRPAHWLGHLPGMREVFGHTD
jgi:hypothetical protein